MPKESIRAALHPADINCALRKRGLTHDDVGALCEPPVGGSMVSGVINRWTTSPNVEATLAELTGFSLEEIRQVVRPRRTLKSAGAA